MLTRARLRSQDGSAMVSALMVMLVMLPLGLALLSIVDTQAKDSGSERTRDRAFNLADSAMSSATFNLGRFAWPTSPATAPTNTTPGPTPATVGVACRNASYGATLGATTNAGSDTAALQPNLNASFDDAAYLGARWQINVCDDDPTSASPTVWDNWLLDRMNYDANGNERVWVRAQATVGGRTRVLAALAKVSESPAVQSKYAVMTGRLNSDLVNSTGAVLSSVLVGSLTSTLLGSDPLIAADPAIASTTPPSSGVTAVRCGLLDLSVAVTCLQGAFAATSALPLLGTRVTGQKFVQAGSLTAASSASLAQLEQQAKDTGTWVASTAGSASHATAPACSIPPAANADTIVYIKQVGGSGTLGSTTGGIGDQFCKIDLSAASVAYKALIVESGRVVLRGDNTARAIGAAKNTFSGFVYAVNEQRARLGDSATAAREVIRIDQGAHVKGGVAADGKSAQVGIYPPPLCSVTTVVVLGITTTTDGCVDGLLATIADVLTSYNPAIQSDVSIMNSVKVYGGAAHMTGTYRDIAGEVH